MLRGDYLDQPLPGDTPVVFAAGVISVDSTVEHGFPTFSPDGHKLYFLPVDTKKEKGLCFVEKQGENWDNTKSVYIIARLPELKYIYGPSITSNGTLYFFAHTEGHGTMNSFGIYRAEFTDGEYKNPELLPPHINAAEGVLTWTPFIAPDERYLLFSSNRREPGVDWGDLFISHRLEDGMWIAPVLLGEEINAPEQERFPGLSPDGKYLFFTRSTEEHGQDVFWVDAKSI